MHLRLTPVDATVDLDHSSLFHATVAADSCTAVDLFVDATFVSHRSRRIRTRKVFRRPLRPDAQFDDQQGHRPVLAIRMAFPRISQVCLHGVRYARISYGFLSSSGPSSSTEVLLETSSVRQKVRAYLNSDHLEEMRHSIHQSAADMWIAEERFKYCSGDCAIKYSRNPFSASTILNASCKQQAPSITAARRRAKNGIVDIREAPVPADYWNKLVTMKTQVLITILLGLALAHSAQASSSNFEKYAVRNSVRSGSAHRLRWRKLTELPTCVNQTLCGSLCVDILTDINNCGVCSNFCDLTQTCCNGTCINPNTNNAHCGACGARCPGTCAAGVCNYGGVTSSPGNGNGGAGNGLAGNGNNGAGPVVPPTGGSGPVVPGTGGPAAGGPGKSGMP
ncbi:unnamed protein product [Closterium sp. NIES-53]